MKAYPWAKNAKTSLRISARFRPWIEALEDRRLLSGMQPSDVAQLALEELNNIRADPAAYASAINLPAIAGDPPVQPLAFNTDLVQASVGHSNDMNTNQFFSHTGSDRTSPGQRATNAGFDWTALSESIAGGSADPDPASALESLIIDSGVPDLGHRDQLLGLDALDLSEGQIGIGIVQNGTGPLVNYYTIDMGETANTNPFICGVVFNDANANGQYDIGEGVGGVTITVQGQGATTSFDSGGYSIQVAPGTYTVTASGGPLLQPISQTVTVGTQNLRLNFNPAAPPAAGTFEFNQLAYDVLDTANQAVITINRIDGSLGTVTIHYATSDGTALAGKNYAAASDNLTFAPGQTSATFDVTIDKEKTPQDPLTLTLTLSKPTGGAALETSQTTLTIADPAISDDTVFVNNAYEDILSRPADAGGLASFQSVLDGVRDQALLTLAVAYVTSPEARGDLITAEYGALINRAPSPSEIAGWTANFQQGTTPEQFITAILGSAEYFALQGSKDSNWINQIYQEILGRSPDASVQAYMTALANGVSRGTIAATIIASTEYEADEVRSVYQTFLNRTPVSAEINGWLNLLSQPSAGPGTASPFEQFEAQILASSEFFLKAGNTTGAWVNGLYADVLARAADQAGFNGTVQNIVAATAGTRQAIANALFSSTEYQVKLIDGYYSKFLGRTPSSAELSGWLTQLQSGVTDEQAITAFVSTTEYFDKQGGTNTDFVDALYQELLGRPRSPSDTGLLNELNNNTLTVSQVAATILGSAEYQANLIISDYQLFLGRTPASAEINGFLPQFVAGATDQQIALEFAASAELFLNG